MSEHAHSDSIKPYALTLAALLTLTVITVGAASVNFGSPAVNVVIALTIATMKATLVALFFMHLRHDKPINAIVFTSSLIFLAIFLGFCLVDVDSRAKVNPSVREPEKIPAAAVAAPNVPAPEHH